MSTSSRSKNSSVIQNLVQNPEMYSFLQAVRLLERGRHFEKITYNPKLKSIQHNFPVAGFVRPDREVIRFKTNQKLEFHSAEISSIKVDCNKSASNKQWDLKVNIMGLTGSMGVLPYHYTELVLERIKMKDNSLINFFELFNHRTISLFYQASVKYRLALNYERNKLHSTVKKEQDAHTTVLLSLIGLGTKNLDNRLHIRDESLLYYSGLLTQKVKTSSGLKQLLQRHFDVPVKIKEFVGQWQTLIDDVRTRLSSRELPTGQNACLGRSALIGRKAWFAQDKIRIVIGPLNKEQLPQFAPGTTTLKALNEIMQFYAGLECNYDFIIQVKRQDIPSRIVLRKQKPPILSWNAWLSQPHNLSKSDLDKNNDIVDIVVSSRRLN